MEVVKDSCSFEDKKRMISDYARKDYSRRRIVRGISHTHLGVIKKQAVQSLPKNHATARNTHELTEDHSSLRSDLSSTSTDKSKRDFFVGTPPSYYHDLIVLGEKPVPRLYASASVPTLNCNNSSEYFESKRKEASNRLMWLTACNLHNPSQSQVQVGTKFQDVLKGRKFSSESAEYISENPEIESKDLNNNEDSFKLQSVSNSSEANPALSGVFTKKCDKTKKEDKNGKNAQGISHTHQAVFRKQAAQPVSWYLPSTSRPQKKKDILIGTPPSYYHDLIVHGKEPVQRLYASASVPTLNCNNSEDYYESKKQEASNRLLFLKSCNIHYANLAKHKPASIDFARFNNYLPCPTRPKTIVTDSVFNRVCNIQPYGLKHFYRNPMMSKSCVSPACLPCCINDQIPIPLDISMYLNPVQYDGPVYEFGPPPDDAYTRPKGTRQLKTPEPGYASVEEWRKSWWAWLKEMNRKTEMQMIEIQKEIRASRIIGVTMPSEITSPPALEDLKEARHARDEEAGLKSEVKIRRVQKGAFASSISESAPKPTETTVPAAESNWSKTFYARLKEGNAKTEMQMREIQKGVRASSITESAPKPTKSTVPAAESNWSKTFFARLKEGNAKTEMQMREIQKSIRASRISGSVSKPSKTTGPADWRKTVHARIKEIGLKTERENRQIRQNTCGGSFMIPECEMEEEDLFAEIDNSEPDLKSLELLMESTLDDSVVDKRQRVQDIIADVRRQIEEERKEKLKTSMEQPQGCPGI